MRTPSAPRNQSRIDSTEHPYSCVHEYCQHEETGERDSEPNGIGKTTRAHPPENVLF